MPKYHTELWFYVPLDSKIGYFLDAATSQSLSLVQMKLILTQTIHASIDAKTL